MDTGHLDPALCPDDPMELFASWFRKAAADGHREPEAMALATSDSEGVPSVRFVLMRGADARGFRFYTNYASRKGRELTTNPRASAAFYWDPPGHQVRIEGMVERLSREESQEYFAARPRGHRVGAWASDQGTVVSSRDELQQRYLEAAHRFQGKDVPLPDYWGGFLLIPQVMEFQRLRTDRMHDRVMYLREGESWSRSRLSP